MQDRDDNYEGSEETEYHFSDVNYEEVEPEAEAESPKAAQRAQPAEPVTAEIGAGRSKRMVVSLVVFMALVFVVYKMVMPSSQIESTDISPKTMADAATTQQTNTLQAPTQLATHQQQAAQPAPKQSNASTVQPAMQGQQSMQQAQAVQQQQTIEQQQAQQLAMQQQQAQQLAMQQQEAQQQMQQQQMQQQQAQQQALEQQRSLQAQATQQQQNMQQQAGAMPSVAMPNVISVPNPVASLPTNSNMPSVATPNNTTGIDNHIAGLQAQNAQLMNQLESDYQQNLNDFSSQNKALQDQVQALNSRMVSMESQLSQLVQALTKQAQESKLPSDDMSSSLPAQSYGTTSSSSYNVQAIIPGRAWLKSKNGETLTVAEGDVIKNLGRVARIDPYDGVVEINTGRKTVSLSYGTGA